MHISMCPKNIRYQNPSKTNKIKILLTKKCPKRTN